MENKTPTTCLEILQWMLAEPGRKAKAYAGGKDYECFYHHTGSLHFISKAGAYFVDHPSNYQLEMLPENLPKRVPFEEVAKAIINSDAMDTHYADYLDFAKAIVKESVTQALEQMREELKK